MKIQTKDLTDYALDWAVAEANRTPIYRSGKTLSRMDMDGGVYWQPTIDWAQGGPIIEREGMQIQTFMDKWLASIPKPFVQQDGPTPLIAAMRCYVSYQLGDEVEVPEELQ